MIGTARRWVQYAAVALLSGSLGAMVAWAQSAPGAQGDKAAAWPMLDELQTQALALKGDPEHGKQIFQICSACHLPTGAGQISGIYPQIAGQHRAVIIKQLGDIIAQRRPNMQMYQIVKDYNRPQDLADVAAYIEQLPIPHGNGKGPNNAALLEKGKALYQKDCARCHGDHGQGDPEKFYPVVAGQHYLYLLRQLKNIKAKKRGNANPDMEKVVSQLSDDDFKALADYLSRLPWPEPQRAGSAGSDATQ